MMKRQTELQVIIELENKEVLDQKLDFEAVERNGGTLKNKSDVSRLQNLYFCTSKRYQRLGKRFLFELEKKVKLQDLYKCK